MLKIPMITPALDFSIHIFKSILRMKQGRYMATSCSCSDSRALLYKCPMFCFFESTVQVMHTDSRVLGIIEDNISQRYSLVFRLRDREVCPIQAFPVPCVNVPPEKSIPLVNVPLKISPAAADAVSVVGPVKLDRPAYAVQLPVPVAPAM